MQRLFLVLTAILGTFSAAPALAACLTLGADERLTARCLIDALTRAGPGLQASIDPLLLRLLARQGLPGVPEQRLTTQRYVQPLLSWARNINGGNPDRPLDVTFYIDDDGNPDTPPVPVEVSFTAQPPFEQAGVLGGLRAGIQGRYIYRPGGYFDFNVYGSYEYAPAHDIGVSAYFGRLCSYNGFRLNWTLDACITTSEINRKYSLDKLDTADLSVSRMFDFGPGFHQRVYAGMRNADTLDYEQPQYFFGIQNISERFPFLAIEATFGEPVRNQTVLLQAVSATVSDQLFGRPFSLSLSHVYSGGEYIFGTERTERQLLVSAAYNVWRGYYVQVGYRDVDSSIDYFDESEPIFGISIASVRF